MENVWLGKYLRKDRLNSHDVAVLRLEHYKLVLKAKRVQNKIIIVEDLLKNKSMQVSGNIVVACG